MNYFFGLWSKLVVFCWIDSIIDSFYGFNFLKNNIFLILFLRYLLNDKGLIILSVYEIIFF